MESKGLSRIFSNTTVQKHQFFGTQLSLWSNSHILYMTIGKTTALTRWIFFSIRGKKKTTHCPQLVESAKAEARPEQLTAGLDLDHQRVWESTAGPGARGPWILGACPSLLAWHVCSHSSPSAHWRARKHRQEKELQAWHHLPLSFRVTVFRVNGWLIWGSNSH